MPFVETIGPSVLDVRAVAMHHRGASGGRCDARALPQKVPVSDAGLST